MRVSEMGVLVVAGLAPQEVLDMSVDDAVFLLAAVLTGENKDGWE